MPERTSLVTFFNRVLPKPDDAEMTVKRTLFIMIATVIVLSGCASKQQESTITELSDISTKKKPVKRVENELIEKNLTPKNNKLRITKQAAVQVSPSPPVLYKTKGKKVFEFVQVNGESYPVPVPWRGNRIDKKSPQRKELRQIPVRFTHNQSVIFVRDEACEAFILMAEKALDDGVSLVVHSGFRSVWYQRSIFSKLMKKGRTWEDLVRYVAPPGYSEHALGTAVDLYPSDWRFASTDQYEWMKKNGQAFGFAETYPEKSSHGFPWEAWHWKYSPEDKMVSQKE